MRRLLPLFILLALPVSAIAASPININTADAALLETLPGIGPVKAQAIIDFRTASGTFPSIDAIQNVKGIGPVTYGSISALITVTGGISTLPPPPLPKAKPSPTSASSKKVQEVESKKVTELAHDIKAVVAPAAPAEAGAAGALASPRGPVWDSPWLYGFLGLVVFSGAALLIL